MVCLINRQASSSARALGQAHTGGAVTAWEEEPGVLVSFMLVDGPKADTVFPRLGMFALLPLQGPFPRCRPGRALGNRSEAADQMPSPIKLASAAMFHLTFPKEFTFLLASPPLPLFSEFLSLQEREV